MKKSLVIGLLAITALVWLGVALQSWTPPPTSFNNLWVETYTQDTVTNSETVYFEFTKKFDYASQVTFELKDTEASGTATCLVEIQQTACNSCSDYWVTTDTLASISATGLYSRTLTNVPEHSGQPGLWGYRVRLKCTSSGTGVHYLAPYALARRLE
jgi:hypothetical protein